MLLILIYFYHNFKPSTDCFKITGDAGTITYDIYQLYNTGWSTNRARSAFVLQYAQASAYTSITSCFKSQMLIQVMEQPHAQQKLVQMQPESHLFIQITMLVQLFYCKFWRYRLLNYGECVVVGTSCVRKTCDTAATDATRDDDSECSAYQQSCTVARLGACQARAACGAYKSSLQCKFNTSGGKCFWNPTNKTCVDLNCGNIEATTSYDTHNECVAVDSTLACTVRATNAAAVQGCMARGACASYTIEEQCKTNASNGVCVWNTNANLSSPACQDKSCTSAPTSTTTHNDCFAYYNTATVRCTVVATPSNSGGSPTLGGCQQTAACSSYIDKEQCQINANGEPCGWNGTQCADKACSTAPATTDYDDDTKCRAYLSNKCTVSDSGLGCVDIPATCETMTQKQCYYNKAGDPCYWTGTACITKSCDNAPDATATAEECNTYLAGCTLDNVKMQDQSL
ncbi:unnamed protein product [Paramecium octaurelia]|uniref:Uncharacterized protein n=1 Tax=Paramecium octaurelia TaxID=43137 RepID=A0A8S1TVP3_PAROT|nr:unnamed protein product [Paramecium octaurelia]